MVEDRISLLDELKGGTFEASLLTTYNATLTFYEEVVLRRLLAAGSRHNVVLMDAAQCALSWTSPSLRPRQAGASYVLVPMVAPGAFHPKMCFLAGKKRSLLFLGSHNLTISGFGLNREVTSRVEIKPNSEPSRKLILRHAWSLVSEWVRTQEGSLAPEVRASILRVGDLLPQDTQGDSLVDDARLIGQSSTGPTLLEQLVRAISTAPRRVALTGAFFDQHHAFLKALEECWPGADFRVIIEPTTVKLGKRLEDVRSRFVDASSLWPPKGYLHAKAMLLDFGDSMTLVAGSANPSRPAWLGGDRSNFEAMLVRPRVDAAESGLVRDLMAAFTAPVMEESELRAIPITAQEGESDTEVVATPIRMSLLKAGETGVTIPATESKGLTRAIAYVEDMALPCEVALTRSQTGDALVELGQTASSTRWLELQGRGERALRVIIHHDAMLRASLERSSKVLVREALANLDFSGADVESLIGIIEKAIFDDDVVVAASGHVSNGMGSHRASDPAVRPSSLASHVDETPSARRRKHQLLQGGSLIEVLDALLHRLGKGLHSAKEGGERVTEEENITNEEELPEPVDPQPLTERAVDLVKRRLKEVVRRMIKQLGAAAGEARPKDRNRKASVALAQLVAVLSLVREFRRLRHLPHWRPLHGFIDEETRRELLEKSMSLVFGRANGIARSVLIDGDEPTELGQTRALLAWLAWDLGDQLKGPIDSMMAPEMRLKRVATYSYLFEHFPAIAEDDVDAQSLRASVKMTTKPTADEGARAERWLNYHLHMGEEIATSPDQTFEDRPDLAAGDLMRVPRSQPAQLRVVAEVTSQLVKLTELDSYRSFRRFADQQ